MKPKKSLHVKAIVFQGAGKAFVAGADIKYFVDKIKADKIADIAAFTRKGHELLLKIENSNKLTIALLDGLSLGGGSELALACQAVVATPTGSMGFTETGHRHFSRSGGYAAHGPLCGTGACQILRLYRHYPSALKMPGHWVSLPVWFAPPEVADAINQLVTQGKPDKYRPTGTPGKI